MQNRLFYSIVEKIQKSEISDDEARVLFTALKNQAEDLPHSLPNPGQSAVAEPRTDRTAMDEIAVIGMAGQFPDANDVDAFWQNLVLGHDAVHELPSRYLEQGEYFNSERKAGETYCKWGGILEERDCFDPLFFNISPREAKSMNPHQRLILQESWKALEDAGYNPKELSNSRVGIFIGSEPNGYFYESFTGSSDAIISSRLSYYLDLKGPALVVDTGCSSSAVAIHLACESLRHGESSLAIAGGILAKLDQNILIKLSEVGMLSPTGRCCAFDESADGTILSEGVGVVALKRLEDAIPAGDHIYGVIKASGMNQDGASNGITAPNGLAQQELITGVYRQYGLNPEDITYVEAHGTGTRLGDPVEANALVRAFKQFTGKEGYCAVGSAKSYIGHTGAAAGVIGLMKILLSLRHHQIPGLINFKNLNPLVEFTGSAFYVSAEVLEWRPTNGRPLMAALNSFGHSGTNVHLVVQEYVPPDASTPIIVNELNPVIIPLSARNKDRLQDYAGELWKFLKRSIDETGGNGNGGQITANNLAAVAHTLQTGREAMEERVAFLARDTPELMQQLAAFKEGRAEIDNCWQGQVKQDKNTVYFLTSGEDMRETPEDWILKAKPGEIAELWAQGFTVDWDRFYGGIKPGRISLPTYPFAREHYWIPEGAAGSAGRGKPAAATPAAVIHPLLHQNTSDFTEQRFTSTFTGEEFFLADHAVKGQRILPGVAYLEMARAAVQQTVSRSLKDGQTGIRLKNVVWAQPIVVRNHPVQIHIGLSPKENGEIAYEVYSESTEAHTKKVVYSQGVAIPGKLTAAPTHDLQALQTRCAQYVLSSSQCYEAFKAIGIDFGPAHQGIQRVHVGSGQVLAKLSLPSSVSDTLDHYVLHPSLLDSAVQASIAMSPMPAGDIAPIKSFIIFALQELEIYRNCAPDMWALIRYSDDRKARDKAQKFDIDLCDDRGNVCARIKGMTPRTLEPAPVSVESAEVHGLLTLEPYWKAQDVSREKEEPNYHQQIVFLCEPKGISSKDIETRMKGVRCHTLRSPQKGIEERYQTYACQIFEEIQAILKNKPKDKVLIQIVVTPINEQQLFSGLSGLLKTARLENPRIIGQLIEVEPGIDCHRIVDRLEENRRGLPDNWIRYQNGKRFVIAWSEIKTAREEQVIPWKDRGIYLITGGAGGLGLLLAKEISHQAREAALILIGRSPLSPEKLAEFEEMKASGARITYRQVDVTRKKAVADLMQSIRSDFGNLNGIIHCAGVIRDSFLIKKTREELREVLNPKVSGLVYLDHASKDLRLDFFVLFSSAAGVLGSPGQADYSAANGFMDAYARYRNALAADNQRHGQTLSINWPFWKEGGMRISKEIEQKMWQDGIIPMETKTGIKALYQGLATGQVQMMVMEGRLSKMKQTPLFSTQAVSPPKESPDAIYNLEATTTRGLLFKVRSDLSHVLSKLFSVRAILVKRFQAQSLKAPADIEPGAAEQAPSLIIKTVIQGQTELPEEADPQDKLVSLLKDTISNSLKIEPECIDLNESLDRYGLDSIIALEINNKLERYFPDLPKTLFFEYNTINELAGYFAESYKESMLVPDQSLTSKNVIREQTKFLEEANDQDNMIIFLQGMIANSLKVQPEQIDLNVSLDRYGLDSIIALEINNKLEQYFSDLSKTIFFEYSTINELAGYFVESYKEDLVKIKDLFKQTALQGNEQSGHKLSLKRTDYLYKKRDKQAELSEPLLIHEDDIKSSPEIMELIAYIDSQNPQVGYIRFYYPYIFISSDKSRYQRLIIDDENNLIIPLMPLDRSIYQDLLLYSQKVSKHLLIVDQYHEWISSDHIKIVPLGVIQNLDINDFTLTGNKMKKLRYLVEKFKKTGEVRIEEYDTAANLPLNEIRDLMIRWSDGKRNIVSHSYTCMEQLLQRTLPGGYRAFLTYHNSALCNIIVIERINNGYIMDQEFYDPKTAPLGHMEFSVVNIIEQIKKEEENINIFSLGLTWYPFGLPDPSIADSEGLVWLKEQYNKQTLFSRVFHQGEANYQFKKKFGAVGEPIFAYVPKNAPYSLLFNYWTVYFKESLTYSALSERISKIPLSDLHHHISQNESKKTLVNTDDLAKLDYSENPLDLLTDSWFNVRSDSVKRRTAYLKNNAHQQKLEVLHAIFPFKHIILTSQGRIAEFLFYQAFSKEKPKILTAIPWTTTLKHQLNNGFDVIEIPDQLALTPQSTNVFKGEMDLGALRTHLSRDSSNIAMVGLEVLSNASGGHPVRLSHIKLLKTILNQYCIPLVLDASRIVRNAYLINKYEDGCNNDDIWEIVNQTLQQAEHVVTSLTKDFAVPVGGLIATNDDQLADDIKKLQFLYGRITEDDKNMIIKALSEKDYIYDLITRQMEFVRRLNDMLIKVQAPVIRPACGHSIIIDVPHLGKGETTTEKKQHFLNSLFTETGIRGSIHQVGKQKNTILDQCVRLAFPLGLKTEDEQRIYDVLQDYFTKK